VNDLPVRHRREKFWPEGDFSVVQPVEQRLQVFQRSHLALVERINDHLLFVRVSDEKMARKADAAQL